MNTDQLPSTNSTSNIAMETNTSHPRYQADSEMMHHSPVRVRIDELIPKMTLVLGSKYNFGIGTHRVE